METVRRVIQQISGQLAREGGRGKRRVAFLLVAMTGLIAVAALIVLPSTGLSIPGLTRDRRGPGDEPSSTSAYLRGQQTYDANLVWESYSDRVVQDLQQRGDSVEQTQRWLNRLRDLGSRIDEIHYIGGFPLATGSMQFYVIARTSPSPDEPRTLRVQTVGQSESAAYVPYTFTLDAKGKIDRVE